jgi:NADH-quinone oxidoreductase chain G
MSIPLIPITINNKNYQVRANASILQVCEEASIDVPRFCYHEKLSVAGNCRMCLVEVEKSPKPVVSCAMPVSKNMVIYTDTPLVKKTREAVLEFLLINHPLDCPICDQGGECDLQDETLQYGSDRGRFFEFKRSVEDKECGPIIKTIMTRCIHCTRCVRFSAEIAGQEVLGSFNRGQETEIGTYIQSFIKTELSGNLVDLCPVGALTSKPYAFAARNWELQKTDTVDFFDGTCADIVVHTRKSTSPQYYNNKLNYITNDEIMRILPRANGLYQDNWISDKSRYAFDGLKKQRLRNIVTVSKQKSNNKITWTDLFFDLSNRLSRNVYQAWEASSINFFAPSKLGAVVESIIDVESLYILATTLKFYGSSDIQYGNQRSQVNIDAPFYYGLNATLDSFEKHTALLLIGTNPRFEASLLNTTLRKQQLSRALPYALIGNYNDLKIKYNHEGTSIKACLNIIENKSALYSKLYNLESSSIIVGVENLKYSNALLLQNIIRFLGKKLFVKTKKGDRLGILHTNVTSLSFANLGITAGVRSILHSATTKDKAFNNLFVIQPYEVSSTKWLSNKVYTNVIGLSTHKASTIACDSLLPIKAPYEKSGFFFNIENRLRKFYKAVSAPTEARSIDAFCFALCRVQFLPSEWLSVLKSFWMFKNEVPVHILAEKQISSFFFNFLSYTESSFTGKKNFFVPAVKNFYINDLITQNSVTMGECALFLNEDKNF